MLLVKKTSFTVALGSVKPLDDIVKIWTYEREGTALALTIGRKVYGKYRWNIVSNSVHCGSVYLWSGDTSRLISTGSQSDV